MPQNLLDNEVKQLMSSGASDDDITLYIRERSKEIGDAGAAAAQKRAEEGASVSGQMFEGAKRMIKSAASTAVNAFNPMPLVNEVLHPIETTKAKLQYQQEHPVLAAQEALGMFGAAQGASAGTRIASGDVEGGVGELLGHVGVASLPVTGPKMIRGAGTATRLAGKGARVVGEAIPAKTVTPIAMITALQHPGIAAAEFLVPPALRIGGGALEGLGSALERTGMPKGPAVDPYAPNTSGFKPGMPEAPPSIRIPQGPQMEPHAPNTSGFKPGDVGPELLRLAQEEGPQVDALAPNVSGYKPGDVAEPAMSLPAGPSVEQYAPNTSGFKPGDVGEPSIRLTMPPEVAPAASPTTAPKIARPDTAALPASWQKVTKADINRISALDAELGSREAARMLKSDKRSKGMSTEDLQNVVRAYSKEEPGAPNARMRRAYDDIWTKLQELAPEDIKAKIAGTKDARGRDYLQQLFDAKVQ